MLNSGRAFVPFRVHYPAWRKCRQSHLYSSLHAKLHSHDWNNNIVFKPGTVREKLFDFTTGSDRAIGVERLRTRFAFHTSYSLRSLPVLFFGTSFYRADRTTDTRELSVRRWHNTEQRRKKMFNGAASQERHEFTETCEISIRHA